MISLTGAVIEMMGYVQVPGVPLQRQGELGVRYTLMAMIILMQEMENVLTLQVILQLKHG